MENLLSIPLVDTHVNLHPTTTTTTTNITWTKKKQQHSWCGPCRMLAPVLQKAVKENAKTVLIKVNVDEAQQVASKYQVSYYICLSILVFKV